MVAREVDGGRWAEGWRGGSSCQDDETHEDVATLPTTSKQTNTHADVCEFAHPHMLTKAHTNTHTHTHTHTYHTLQQQQQQKKEQTPFCRCLLYLFTAFFFDFACARTCVCVCVCVGIACWILFKSFLFFLFPWHHFT